MAAALTHKLRDGEAIADQVFTRFFNTVSALELLPEEEDVTCILDKRVDPSDAYLGQLCLSVLASHLGLLRIIYDLGALYEADDEVLYIKYRGLCEKVWLFAPFIRHLESVVAVASLPAFMLSFEAAEAQEQEYLIDLFIDLDSYQQRLPKDRRHIATIITWKVQLLTGRVFLA
jgi:hypothetical protein